MDKTLRKKIGQIGNIVMGGKTRLFLKLVKNNLSDNFQHKYYNKEEKIDLLKKGKYKNIKYALDSVKSSDYNREIINEEYYKIDLFYNKYGIDQEYLDNAKDFIDDLLSDNFIDNRSFFKSMQLINGHRFLVNSKTTENGKNHYINMEIKPITNKNRADFLKVGIDLDAIKTDNIIVRHVDKFVDFTNMDKCILEGKENIINKIDSYKDINFVYSCAWFGDRDFINWWKGKRNGKKSKIIDLFEKEQEYSYWMGKNDREEGFWRKRINRESSLASSIEEYERDIRPLAEGKRFLDLDKMKEGFESKKI